MKRLNGLLLKHKLRVPGYIPILYIFFTFLFLLVRFSERTSIGVREGIKLCFDSLVPSLYPFMIAVELLNSTGILTKNNRLINFLSLKIFRLPYSFSVFILSCLGGYPVGAICVKKLLELDAISEEEGEEMLLFTVNPSLNFAVTFVGAMIYKSLKIGILLYISVIMSSLICGVICGLFNKKERTDSNLIFFEKKTDFSVAFTTSVKNSAQSMFYICAFTVLFSVICELIEILPFTPEIKLFLKCISEVTNGVKNSFNVHSLPFTASILSFGGLSVVFQIFSELSDFKISRIRFFCGRAVTAWLSYIIAFALLKIFPVTVSTFCSGAESYGALTSHSVPVSVGLILMTLILIADDIFFREKRLDTNSYEL